MAIGQVVNVQAMLTGNAAGMQSAFAQGSAAAKQFEAAYQSTATGVKMSSAQIQATMQKDIAMAQAQAAAAQAAAEKAAASRSLAAAQAAVAADREAAAHAKAAAAATAASEAKVRADAIGTQSAITSAAAQQAAAERAANTAALASQQKIAANAKAAEAATAEAAAVAKAMATEEAAVAASARANEYAAAQKQAAHDKTAAIYTKLAAGVTLAAGAVGVGAVMMAADFEASTLKLHTSGGMAMDDLAKVRDGILEIAQSTGVGAKELADGMYDVVSGGYQGADALNILKAATQGAKAEGADLSIMAQGLTAVMASYNIPADQAVQTTNAISAASGAAKGNLQEFTGSLATILPVAANTGISFAEISAAIATMTQSGKSADQATQELRNGLLNLAKPNEVASKMMQQLGIDANDVANNLSSRGLGGTLNYLTEKILESSEGNKVLLGTFKESEEAARAMTTMLGSMPPQLQEWSKALMDGSMTSNEYTKNVNTLGLEGEALGDQFLKLAKKSAGFSDTIKKGGPETVSYTGALATMMGGTTGLQVALDLTGNRAAAFAETTRDVAAAQAQAAEDVATHADIQSTVAAAWDRLTATVGVLAIQLGTVLLPAAQAVIGAFSESIRFFQENEGAAQALGLIVGGLATHIIATTVAMHAWAAAKAIAALASGGLAGAITAVNVAMKANPIGVVIGLLTALAAGFIWCYENVGWFREGVDTAMKTVGDVMGGFFTWVTEDAIPGFITGWEGLTKGVTDSIEGFTRWKDETLGMFEDFNNNTKGMFEDFATNTTGTIQTWNDDTTGMFEDFNTNTQGMFDDFFTTFGEGWEGYWQDPIGETETFINTTTQGFEQWDRDTTKTFTDWATNTWNGFNGWAEDTNETVRQWGEDAKKDIDTFNSETNTNLETWWTDTWNGFDGWAKDVNKTVDTWGKDAKADIDTFNSETNTSLENWWTTTWNGFDGWGKDVNETVRSWAANDKGQIDTFNRDTNDAFSRWWEDTNRGFEGWSNDVQRTYENWKNNTKGKTREFIDDSERWIGDFNRNTNGMFTDMGQHISNSWQWIQDRGKEAGDWISRNVFDPLNRAVGWVGDAFTNVAKWVGEAWNNMREAAKAPVKFVVETIYTNGIRALWNPVASTFGLAQLPAAPSLGFADGGVFNGYHTGGMVPGYTPGRDTHTIAVGGGEAIMRPEWTRAVGLNGIREMNKAAKANDGEGVKRALGSAVAGFADGGVFDPSGISRQIDGGPGKGTNYGDAILGLPVRLIAALVAQFTKAAADAAAAAANAVGTALGIYRGGPSGLGNPLPGAVITQRYHAGHNGIDMAAPTGTPIMAAGNGRVSFAGWSSGGGGNEVHIDHVNGLQTWYAHMNGLGVRAGMNVSGGSVIGPVGSTGNSTGPHLHFMTLNGGWPNHMNPAPFIGLANGGVVPTFDRGGTLGPGMNLVNNATAAPEPLTPTNDLPEQIAAAIREALDGLRLDVDGEGIGKYIAGKLVLASQRRAGRS